MAYNLLTAWRFASSIPAFFVGCVTPLEISGPALLRDELKQNGVAPSMLPESCIAEIANNAILGARLVAKHDGNKYVHSGMINLIERVADEVSEVLMVKTGAKMGEFDRERITAVLARHGVAVGASRVMRISPGSGGQRALQTL